MIAAGFECPEGLDYDIENQVWARLEADGTATVGITALGVHLAGEVYMCRPKSVGTVVERGRGIAVVELAKSIVSVKTPLSGRVVAVNPRLAQEPERVHLDPYGEGWLARILPLDVEADRLAVPLLRGEAVAAAMQRHAWLHRAADDAGSGTTSSGGTQA
jgi:glycine cleavage system H protein